ncbi:uncharacterized protein LOC122537354 isoform X2 [Frieseomelitta varia]|nr:uncharacterized protein LOC122537354 isoform X2 [Frieseomelitta varia]
MKQILAVCLLLTAVNAVFLESSERPLNRFHLERWFPLLGLTPPTHQFIPPGHRFPLPEHLHPPGHIQLPSGQLPSCTILDDLFSKDQQNKESEFCTVVRICHNPLINKTLGTTVQTPTPQPQTTESFHGGEGIIDIRVGN